ncbi:hypothetical protein [Dokdonia sp. Hel_I_53]|uniref:hypothetical protein n=1 Tax=Dokdonia sp. Hel_I_53 TaxID=1566287 RepID=UPI00119B6153|nr:hypothetical protein [Dokdonia sp. Hel_I_53]TVZ51786.1 hypothetical protein OD90_0938 [Dokdonia sp. Hel_I_53]
MDDKLMSKKKPSYPVREKLDAYLKTFARKTQVSISYQDLLRFTGGITVYDKHENDTLWIRVYYPEFEQDEIEYNLKRIYTQLHSDGNENVFDYLKIDAIDFCTFGNSKPFRIKIMNVYNNNYVYFYVKQADASRIYGLELEHILSPNRINFLVFENTLIEEHIAGIPGDEFINNHLQHCDDLGLAQIAKEFVKFNERCMITLLGDMRSYNFVVIPTHDFDHVRYKIRAIDFDQQCYEGNFKVYQPAIFKENIKYVRLVAKRLDNRSIEQYRNEERALLAKRILNGKKRLTRLLRVMSTDPISSRQNVRQLRADIFEFTSDIKFKRAANMGAVLRAALEFVKRNYEDVSVKRIVDGTH